MKLLGISGYARTGKDTAALALIEEGWTRVALADRLKEEVLIMLERHCIRPDLSDPATKEQLRPLLVFWGAYRRSQDPDYWIKKLPGRNKLVIPDVRYLNECKHILALGGKLIYLARPTFRAANDEEERSFAEIAANLPLMKVGTFGEEKDGMVGIINSGTVATLRKKIRKAMNEWGWL